MSRHNNYEMLKFLLERIDVNINYKNHYGYSAYLEACKNGNLKIIKFLKENYQINLN